MHSSFKNSRAIHKHYLRKLHNTHLRSEKKAEMFLVSMAVALGAVRPKALMACGGHRVGQTQHQSCLLTGMGEIPDMEQKCCCAQAVLS